MPVISQFYGILIYIYKELNERHHLPHFHAHYAEYKAVYDFDGNRLAGELPRKQNKLVDAWCAIHQDELTAAWTAWNDSGEIIKIEGLR